MRYNLYHCRDQRDLNTIYKDTKIRCTIVNKFCDDDHIKPLNIYSGCYRGHVNLVGEYDRAIQKKHSIQIAKSIEGVKSETAYLIPKKSGDLCGIDENLTISGKVKAKLIGDKDIWSTNIHVKSVQCNVVLYGFVETKHKIKKAIGHAKRVEGIRGVKSFLTSANQLIFC